MEVNYQGDKDDAARRFGSYYEKIKLLEKRKPYLSDEEYQVELAKLNEIYN